MNYSAAAHAWSLSPSGRGTEKVYLTNGLYWEEFGERANSPELKKKLNLCVKLRVLVHFHTPINAWRTRRLSVNGRLMTVVGRTLRSCYNLLTSP